MGLWQAAADPSRTAAQQARQWRQARSVAAAGSVAPPLPVGCQVTAVVGGDDDDGMSEALNWTDGAVHCSHAGLTAIPPLPATALYL